MLLHARPGVACYSLLLPADGEIRRKTGGGGQATPFEVIMRRRGALTGEGEGTDGLGGNGTDEMLSQNRPCPHIAILIPIPTSIRACLCCCRCDSTNDHMCKSLLISISRASMQEPISAVPAGRRIGQWPAWRASHELAACQHPILEACQPFPFV